MNLLTYFSGVELNKRHHANSEILGGPCERFPYWARSPDDYVTRVLKWAKAKIMNPAPQKRFGLVTMVYPRQAIGTFPPLMKHGRDIREPVPRKVHSQNQVVILWPPVILVSTHGLDYVCSKEKRGVSQRTLDPNRTCNILGRPHGIEPVLVSTRACSDK